MTGAQSLIRTLVDSKVDVCFANPGTSEMHFVAALDAVPEMRAVLALFEGVVTGAADGYGRMTGRPAATLLHLGPGLGNGIANLHNARRARTPIVNIVGEHATYHQRFDAPLQSDIVALAGNVSKWVRVCATSDDLAADATDAVAAAMGPPGGFATLVVPADVSWGTVAGTQARQRPVPPVGSVPADTIESVRKVLDSEEPVVILLGGRALRERGLRAAASIAEATGATLLAETFPARLERGGGLPPIERLAYLGEMAIGQLASARHIVLVDTPAPVSFFAYPDQPSELWPTGCELHVLAGPEHDVTGALEALAVSFDRPGHPNRATSRIDHHHCPLSSDRLAHIGEPGGCHRLRASRGRRGRRRVQHGRGLPFRRHRGVPSPRLALQHAAVRSGWVFPWRPGRPSAHQIAL